MEKIICSAIKYPDAIFLGKRHCDCFKLAAVNNKKWSYKNESQGFWTNKDRFVGRIEARKIAIKAGQLLLRASNGDILYSEDIY